jgi:hypothetical protein
MCHFHQKNSIKFLVSLTAKREKVRSSPIGFVIFFQKLFGKFLIKAFIFFVLVSLLKCLECLYKFIKLYVLLVCDWLHSFWQNHFYVMLPFYQGCRFFQGLHFRNVLQEVQRRFYTDSKSEKSDPKLPFERPSHASGRPSVSKSFELFKVSSV